LIQEELELDEVEVVEIIIVEFLYKQD